MQILHLTDHYPPTSGGIETHVAALAQRQAARGDEVTVVTTSPRAAEGRLDTDDGPVRVIRVPGLLDGLRLDLSGYDLLHAHLSVVAPFTAPAAAVLARRGLPTLVTVHSLWSHMGPLPGAAVALAGLRGAPVAWSSVSTVAATELAAHLPPAAHVHVLPNAVEVAPRRRTPDGGGAVKLVSTMRLARRKRPLALLRAVDLLRRSSTRPVQLTVVGDGPYRARMNRLARRLGLSDHLTITGRVNPAVVLEHLEASDIYIAPAVLESFGLAALEARCVGLPVVGRTRTGLSEFVAPGREGLLCESDRGVVSALRLLVHDEDVRRSIAEHNRTVPARHTWARALQQHDRAYQLTVGRVLTKARQP